MTNYRVCCKDPRLNGIVISVDPKTVARVSTLSFYVRRIGYVRVPVSNLEELSEEETNELQRYRAVRH